jgi:hypothetical protein
MYFIAFYNYYYDMIPSPSKSKILKVSIKIASDLLLKIFLNSIKNNTKSLLLKIHWNLLSRFYLNQ